MRKLVGIVIAVLLLSLVGFKVTDTVMERRLAAQPIQNVTLCSLGSDWLSAEGKPLRIDTDVQFGMEGAGLYDHSCPDFSYVLSTDAEDSAAMEKLAEIQRNEKAPELHVVIEGHLYRPTLYRKLYERIGASQTKPIPVFLLNRTISAKPVQ